MKRFGSLVPLLLGGVIVYALGLAPQASRKSFSQKMDPLDLLQERYAHGEISGVEYEIIREQLRQKL